MCLFKTFMEAAEPSAHHSSGWTLVFFGRRTERGGYRIKRVRGGEGFPVYGGMKIGNAATA